MSDKLEDEFRRAVFEKFGMKKGNIAKAIEEAVERWIEREKERRYEGAK